MWAFTASRFFLLSWAPWIVVTPGRTTSSTPSATRQRTAASVTTETGGRVNDHIVEAFCSALKIFSVVEEASSSAGFGGMVPTGRTVMPVPSSG